MALDVLTVRRSNRRVPGEEHLGHTVTVPQMDWPSETPPEKVADVDELFDWEDYAWPGTRFDAIDATALVAPSDWERWFVDWLASRVGLDSDDVEWPKPLEDLRAESTESAPGERLAAAVHDGDFGWSGGAEVPEGLLVRRADTPRGEARAAGVALRRELLEHAGTADSERALEFLDGVSVLLPNRAKRTELWRREFERLGLPTRTSESEPLASTGVGRWLIDLTRLENWRSTSVPRALLRDVFLSPIWSWKALVEQYGEKGDRFRFDLVRKAIASLRRTAVGLDNWLRHLEALEFDDQNESEWQSTRRILKGWSRDLADAFSGGSSTFFGRAAARLDETFSELVAGKLAHVGDSAKPGPGRHRAALKAALNAVRTLARRESETDGRGLAGLRDGAVRASTLLREELQTRSAPSDDMIATRGALLTTYEAWDGRESKRLVLAGLGEGSFPKAPTQWSPRERKWAEKIGLLDPDGDSDRPESVEIYRRREVERQNELALSAALRCSGEVTLSYAESGEDTDTVHPGAFLSLLVGGWDEETWNEANAEYRRVDLVRLDDEIPEQLEDAHCWSDARLFADSLFEHYDDASADQFDETCNEQLEEICGIHSSLAGSRRCRDERRFATAEPIEPGGYTGRLPDNPNPRSTFSASSLEAYGQCPTKYFYGRVLGLADEEDADTVPSSLEEGNALHRALHRVAQKYVAAESGGAWDLTYDRETKEQTLEERHDELVREMERTLRELSENDPNLSDAYVGHRGVRWNHAIEIWLDDNIIESSESFERRRKHDLERTRREIEEEREKALNVVDTLAEAIREGDGDYTKTALKQATPSTSGLEIKAADRDDVIDAAYSDGRERGLEAATKKRREIHERYEEKLESKIKEKSTEWEENRSDRPDVSRHVFASELGFGRNEEDDNDPRSLEKPLEIEGDRVEFALRGSVDRVDYDPGRNRVSVRDYKSGSNSPSDLDDQILAGEHVQLPVYAWAVREMANRRHLPELDGAEVVEAALDYPKVSETKSVDLTEVVGENSDLTLMAWAERWLEAHVRNIRDGLFMPVPNGCPIQERGSYCDYEDVCRSIEDPLDEERVQDSREAPEVPTEEEEPETDAPPEPDVPLPTRKSDEIDRSELLERHREAGDLAMDTERDVVLAAGAGSGKTYNLVRRYLQALDDGVSPENILCITFTRKAAAEMKSRVRQALLQDIESFDDKKLANLVESIRGENDELGHVLAGVSAAPISTIDSLAGEIVRAGREVRETLHGEPALPFEAVPASAVRAQLKNFVDEKFLDALESGDERLDFLVGEITVGKAREYLEDTVQAHPGEVIASVLDEEEAATVENLEDALLDGWSRLAEQVADEAAEFLASWDLDELDRCVEQALESGKLEYDGPEQARQIRDAAHLVLNENEAPLRRAGAAITLAENSPTKKRMGGTELYEFLDANMSRPGQPKYYDAIFPKGARREFKKAFEGPSSLERPAEIAARALSIASEWEDAFVEELRKQGRMRHGDVEREALKLLDRARREGNEEFGLELAAQFPYRHVFVDETQDTSETQVELIEALADVVETHTEDVDHCRRFWIGDLKQSIYRFRDAEVDVFEEKIDDARRDESNAELANLGVNYRSRPRLIRFANELFSRVLPARRNGESLDPGSGVDYEPLTWPDGKSPSEDGAPPVEVIAEPGKGWTTENGEESDGDDEGSEPTPLECATVDRIRGEVAERDEDAEVAVLVSTWERAARMRELLERCGIRADVQGGGGLMEAPECRVLRMWLEAALYPDRDTPLIAALRGPGMGISDVGLYCLRHGFGVEPRDGVERDAPEFFRRAVEQVRDPDADRTKLAVKNAARFGRLDPEQACRDWAEAGGEELDGKTVEALEKDAGVVDRFSRLWRWFRQSLGFESTAETLEELLERTGMRAFWSNRPGGRQRVMNIDRFLSHVRDIEAEQGVAPRAIHRRLEALAEGDDPATDGLLASRGAEVIVTTYWQAKGREWPVVVLPTIHKSSASGSDSGFGPLRVVDRYGETPEPIQSFEVKYTPEEKPFETKKTLVSKLFDIYRKPNDRAETRRLLYVAVTRAEEKLVISGEFDRYRSETEDADEFALDRAKNWAHTIRTATGLQFDQQGQPEFPDDSPWHNLVGSHLTLSRPADIADELPDSDQTFDDSTSPTVPDLADLADRWRPVSGSEIESVPPSQLGKTDVPPAPVPEPLDGSAPEWPETRPTLGDELPTGLAAETLLGTAFHDIMRRWAFGSGVALEDAIDAAIDRTHILTELRELDRVESLQTEVISDYLQHLADNVRSSPLTDELEDAARRGDLYHEVPLRFVDDDGPANARHHPGTIDLVWRDGAGDYHLLDYKAGTDIPTADDDWHTHDRLRTHYAQVGAYARGFDRLAEAPVADFGLWFIAAPTVVRWRV